MPDRQAVHVVPITFQDRGAHIKVVGNEGQTRLNITFSFRTYEQDGVLAFHNFLSNGYIKVTSWTAFQELFSFRAR